MSSLFSAPSATIAVVDPVATDYDALLQALKGSCWNVHFLAKGAGSCGSPGNTPWAYGQSTPVCRT